MEARTATRGAAAGLAAEPYWYKDAIIYQVHIRSFRDSNGDGIGDLPGLVEKLDYLQDLGTTAIWLQPFYPSPLRDDGYDIADYANIHPDYGTIADFRILLREAHRRGLRVITELVVNHTSDQHPWFQRARRAKPGSSHRDFYVWSDTPDKYSDTRIIFKDFETSNWAWDPLAKAYYWHRFYNHQPDLNFDNKDVQRAVRQVLNFWLDMGVDGLRLDAVPYLFEREGTSCENLPETHAYLKQLRKHVDTRYGNRMLLAEANQWPEDAVQYFGEGKGDECHMAFHFPLMPRLFMGIRMEDRFPIIDILQQTPAIPESAQWATFLRNHDELTLEMVTDEDRDYMYRVYAQDPRARINLGIRRRLSPLLGNDRRRVELMNGLLLSLPGTPVIYYGDEIGMGDNIYLGDRNGVRTPMQWSSDRNAGFSGTNPQRLFLPVITDPEYHYEAINVEAQQHNPHSQLWWLKRLIALRKRHRAFGRGVLEFLSPDNRKILAYLRRTDQETLLAVANLSRFVQPFELDLREFVGSKPVELFGRTPFAPISDRPYPLTLGPHSFYWFALQPADRGQTVLSAAETGLPVLQVPGGWKGLLKDGGRDALEEYLPSYLRKVRWFGGKARSVTAVEITETIPVTGEGIDARWILLKVAYTDGEPDTYAMSLAVADGARAQRVMEEQPWAAIAQLKPADDPDGKVAPLLYDPSGECEFGRLMLEAIAHRRRFRNGDGAVVARSAKRFRFLGGTDDPYPEPKPIRREQSNTSIAFGDRFIMKLFRRIEQGVNPDLEIGRFLTERAAFEQVPWVAGAVEYERPRQEPLTLGILQGFVENQGDAWQLTLDALGRFYERILARPPEARIAPPTGDLLEVVSASLEPEVQDILGTYLRQAELMGRRVAELHLALASNPEDPAFAPEKFPPNHQRSLYQSLRNMLREAMEVLQRRRATLPEVASEEADRLLAAEPELMRRARRIMDQKMSGQRIRTHGDLHLGQILFTGRDFVIIDFEGEPRRSISERRLKRSPLRDAAGMLRSFHYAAYSALYSNGGLRTEDIESLETWATSWTRWISRAFLESYLAIAEKASILPKTRGEVKLVTDHFVMDKAAYELLYELNARPDWVRIPIRGLLALLESEE